MTDQTQGQAAAVHSRGTGHINKPLFAITGGFIAAFCLVALIDLELLSTIVDTSFAFSARYFGLYWQVLLLATFLIGLVLIVLPGGKAIMGTGPEVISVGRTTRSVLAQYSFGIAQSPIDKRPAICQRGSGYVPLSIPCFPFRTSANSILADCATLLHFREQVEN